MARAIISAVLFLLLAACGEAAQKHYDAMKPLTNDQIIYETKKCHANGERVFERDNSFGEAVEIQCFIKDEIGEAP